ncbi:hypothetical protein [Nonomuraea sp. NPDC049709]|uniref:hypothetical protein n=1 Tax=Nonomuraea sp. NPDC049709 TaxID=3154736 RepID=UPI00343B87F5
MTMSFSTPGDDFDPAPYRAAGIPADEAHLWWRWRLTAAHAAAWRRAGIADPALATQWATARVTPETLAVCRAAGLTAAEALLWHEYEFTPDEAIDFKRRGLTPDQAFDIRLGRKPRPADDTSGPGDAFSSLMSLTGGGVATEAGAWTGDPQDRAQRFVARAGNADGLLLFGYINDDWLDDEAIAWARHGVDAPTARMWQDLGLRPAEAKRYLQRGLNPMAVARAWWQAGIPFEETASWAGAGLTPEEAVEQRARGVTAEQAETLRALRDNT